MAMAPEQTGIGIRRHFTTEGVHPFDEVTWERRDARIVNFRDGSVAFEQRDVEFPVGWSLNATNIVAQKYFRGQLGSPEREQSLRQVIDRVSDTITGWGVKDGYFVDDAEAEAFRAELKHLILHQKAAFNSPVWFNIGVPGANQQASACFILAVEDTMQSILNWYVEEGTIFKGGSGAGINLSNIRSSYEHLKGGGTASGPVSFMRGADASAGTIKSGGTTRRAAKMVVLNVDHPDIEDFIWCKAVEERKARVLRDAGFDMDLDGKDSHSTQYQNANNSVRVTDEFMAAVVDDADWGLKAVSNGEVLKTVKARELFRQMAESAWECADPGMQYDTTINKWHTVSNTGRINASNPCSEYLSLDNSACNLASLNLLKFLNEDGTFDVKGFKAAVEVVFTAQEILVGNADYPTRSIGETTRRFRQLGLGYANLGAMLMAIGVPYDSDAGRAWASGITALMTGHAYATSARTAARMGPFAGYMENQEPMNNVLRMHRDELGTIDTQAVPADILAAADESWGAAVEWGGLYGVRNSQATVLAPTGCLVGGSLVPTSKGLVRLATLGDSEGPQWQDLGVEVATDEGPRPASRFYVNGLEPVVSVRTTRGYGIEGTTQHRIKVIDRETGAWEWKRFADLEAGDVVPLALNQLLGRHNRASLPAIPVSKAGDGTDIESHLHVPSATTPQLAELAGYFIAEGSVSAKGLTFNVADSDLGVVEHIERLGKEAFGVPALVTRRRSGTRVAFRSPRLAEWWSACGFSRRPLLPDAVLRTNDRSVYAAFLRGLFQAGGQVASGLPRWSTPSLSFSREVQSLLLALGYPTIRTLATERGGWRQAPVATVRLLNSSLGGPWLDEVGFMSERANRAVAADPTSTRHDDIPLPTSLVARLAPANPWLTGVVTTAGGKGAGPGITMVSRTAAVNLFERSQDRDLGHLLAFFYDRVASAELGDDELTYDISVPDNVTYLANGFVSHNTIGLMMDCDTTGIEPDLGLCKTKKLVGGGTMSIVNQTVPRALRRMGYSPEQVDDIVAYIDEHKSIVGAPHLSPDKLAVFACSMGDNVIHYLGHVKMMAAVQPWISGAISKCVTGDTLLATADGLVRIGRLHQDEPADSFRPEIIEVASVGGTQKTDAFYYGGVRPVRKAVLESGHRVMGTPNHRLLVAGDCGLDWRRLDELAVGDAVAVHYGADLWSSLPARLDGAVPVLPVLAEEMTSELAFLLGALAAAGRADRAAADGPSVVIDGVADPVLARIAEAWAHDVGLPAGVVDGDGPGDPGAVIASSPLAVQLLGSASTHVPDAVLASPKEMVLAYLEGLSLAADVSVEGDGSGGSWSLVLDCEPVLDEVQAVLTNLGIVHWRAAPDRIEVVGLHAQRLVDLVPFAEPAKEERARALAGATLADEPEIVVPGLSGDDRAVVGHDLRFSPVVAVSDAGRREVFDVSVPTTHAFVGNGIVNHNTINMPEEATVEEVEQLHIDAWRMGLKAVAIYRDNCKVGQPLSTTKKGGATGAPAAAPVGAVSAAAPVPATLVSTEPVRRKMPRVRSSKTMSFRVADCHGYVTVGEYDDGRPGEIFLKVAKQGSTLAGIMDAFAISVSHGLQYGVPLRAFVDMYTNMRFEPAGMTDDPDIRFASSLVDYIFRRLAVEYLSYEDRAELGILTVEERMQPTLPGVEEQATPSSTGSDIVPDPASVVVAPAPMAAPVAEPAPAPAPPVAPVVQPVASDAPYCYQCGMVMQRAGACFVCSTCGTTSGCS